MNYEKDMRIDEDALDIEWLEQPTLMLKYAQHAALLRSNFDKSKEKLEFVKAKIDKDIRSNPEKYGLEKITDKVVENTTVLQNEYKSALIEFQDLKFENDVASGVIKAVEARKDALENLVRLHGLQYFAGPQIPRDIRNERAARERQNEIKKKEINKEIARSLSRLNSK